MNARKQTGRLDAAINALRPGYSVTISEGNGYRVFAERSCDGKTLRIVRESGDGFQVIGTDRF
jgi:hypothetical protein